MATDSKIHTATPRKNRVLFGANSVVCPADQSHAITNLMSPPTPYDRTTPPSSALLTTKPFPKFPVQTSSNTPTPPSHDRRTPRPPPREHGMQDDLYYAFTHHAYLSSETAAAKDVVNSLTSYCPPKQYTQRLLPLPPMVRRHPSTTKPRLITPSTTPDSINFNNFTMDVATRQLPPTMLPKSKASLKSKPVTWTFPHLKKKRRGSEIFNINFGFNFSSRRRSPDYSPQVSPRTSFSFPSGSPREELEDSFKRQRIDSTSEDMDVVFSTNIFGAHVDTNTSVQLPSTHCDTTGEAHPGQPVDFSTPPPTLVPDWSVPAPIIPRGDASSDFKLRLSSDAYHDYLATTQRRKSFPSTEWAAKPVRDEFQMIEKMDKPKPRANTVVEQPTTTKVQTPIMEAQPLPPCELRRTTSDPCTEAFLTHIRASLEARKTKTGTCWQTYPVFADEFERGFLDDAPL
ncbi:hypothetical protein Ptr902_12498 [Pyrenophora tritici-repentis]|nr:hypothetical protein Ptr902_12498 [Pyrenophora tritici-repentis]